MKRVHRKLGVLAALVLVLAAAMASARDEPGFQRVTIPLIEPGKPVPADPPVTGYVIAPAGRGPFPAVVLVHGCNGLDWDVPGRPGWVVLRNYGRRYAAHGYVALVLDSFAPRGVRDVCGRPLAVGPGRRAWDALSAARYLGTRADVDPKRLVLQGDSHGGWTALVTLETGRFNLPERFAAGIAWYPYCYPVRGFTAPLLVLIGDRDDWTPAERCTRMAATLQQSAAPPLELHIFPGATHGYDFPGPARTNRLGHFMAHDAAATAASWAAIDAFLAAHLRPS